ncbi:MULTISPECIES: malonate transporter subunit MadL [Mycobacteriaceae]|uniref:Malonate transporter subunit MadL n=1 Tax=Mycolicibacterium parafortuitum TaxID=39692 RepID=A0ACC6MFQ3_MYCPF|nr:MULTISPECIES: malonate transporter subunit MadL [Mycobacteriaceae]MBX7450112.1 malonate transporter subunit MadL [Mycolicibacterium aurantiacum]MEC9325625.1 malonate transporter subunit MadL [Actinomycetota bacterium]MDZ5085737.1 malonate transporter subunit MadL [Mycolicibacterium parafortuitum]GFM17453.1 malonate transporter, MadL subunit [Mycobacterium sp. PO1]GFM23080.1 malonate transporter, MadL subunit [Mycobacterium sp. PO2]
MVLYGVAALALCMLAGAAIGELLGVALGVDANVGGVGFAMIMLILATDWLRRKDKFPKASEQGVLFWSAMYIPIVIAMASTQNVAQAITGGPMAILAGLAALAAGAALVPVLARIGEPAEPLPPLTEEEKQEA